ncbi:sensor histidine kinase [Paenibacillus sp. IITD108]|uniref:sensor histidine kinase n=2 Tax=unclassified Paenibacillus TaxID=185978 RepID=UPI002F40A1C7
MAAMFERLVRRFHHTTFRKKLILTYIIIIVVPVMSALFASGLQLYKQTNTDYENILQQLNRRTNVTLNDFFTSLARSSFFYMTQPRLMEIVRKTRPSSEQQYISDGNYMQSSMEQFVLINSNIAMISIVTPNGGMYGSKPEKVDQVMTAVSRYGKEKIKQAPFIVTEDTSDSKSNHTISIIRYLSDLYLTNGREGYVKVDIYNRAFENMLGGISDDSAQLGTLVLDGNKILYNSDAFMSNANFEEMERIAGKFQEITRDEKKTLQLKYNGKQYLFSGNINEVTGWTIIQFIPVNHIFDTFVTNTLNYVLLSVLSLLAAFVLAFFFHRYFILPILNLSKSMKTVDTLNVPLPVRSSDRGDEIGRLINSFNEMFKRLKESRESEIASSNLQKIAELKMLQSQINPHFLYNTLNTIHAISELHRLDQISIMTKSLSSIYRYNIKFGDEVTIGNELEQINNYIKIQQIRFLNKFKVEYDIDKRVLSYKILKFLIQPIIENSFYHGLEPKGGQGILKLTIKQLDQTLFISVQDDGVGIPPDKLKELTDILNESKPELNGDNNRNFGIRNVHARIRYFYGENYRMEVNSSEQQGTTIMMYIPISEEMSSNENTNS